ncbi:MAG TPA: ribonuclease H [Gemmatimonadaceae bacterium]|nr:ribonuclease H [Gemmatimonadaceae bacterium]
MPGRELVAVYADESCLGNGREGENPGGAGVLVEYRRTPDAPLVRRDLWLSERATTNNRMALQSVIAAFHALGARGGTFDVVFTSDSRYIVDGMTQWVHGWSRRGWSRKGGAIENLELWFEALEAAAPHAVRWDWVRGHAGHAQNEYANHLATTAAAQQTTSAGLVASGFDAWFAAERARGARHADPADFPDRSTFRAHAALPAPPA